MSGLFIGNEIFYINNQLVIDILNYYYTAENQIKYSLKFVYSFGRYFLNDSIKRLNIYKQILFFTKLDEIQIR